MDTTLERMCADALARAPEQEAIEFEERWIDWGEVRALAEHLKTLLQASGVTPATPIAFVPRNRPAFAAALLAMLARARTVRMVYAFQSPAGIARDLSQLEPQVVIAAAEDFSPEVRAVLAKCGAAAVALSDMQAAFVAGFEQASGAALGNPLTAPEIQILTSGTTGRPKRFGLTHELVARHVVTANKNYHSGEIDLTRAAPMFSYYPLGNLRDPRDFEHSD